MKKCIDCGAIVKKDYFGACESCKTPSQIIEHGGNRKGAGRPKGSSTKEPTKVIRVPVSKLEAVQELIKNT